MAIPRRWWAHAARLDRPLGGPPSGRSAAPRPRTREGPLKPASLLPADQLVINGRDSNGRPMTLKSFPSSSALHLLETIPHEPTPKVALQTAAAAAAEHSSAYLSSMVSDSTSQFRLLMQNVGAIERILAGRDFVMLELEILRHIEMLGARKLFHECLSRAVEMPMGQDPLVLENVSPCDEQHAGLVVRTGKARARKLKRKRTLDPASGILPATPSEEFPASQNRKEVLSRTEAEISDGIKDLLLLERTRDVLAAELGRPVTYTQWADAAGVNQAALRKRLQFGWYCRDRLLKSTISLVKYIAKNYRGMGVAFDDILQAGKIGVLNGANRFDSRKGYKFSTYVHHWIKKAILQLIAQHSRGVQLPARRERIIQQVQKARREIRFRTGRHPRDEEISRFTGLSTADVRIAARCSPAIRSIDKHIGNGCTKLMEVIEDTAVQSQYEAVAQLQLKQSLQAIIEELEPREQRVIKLRYGLGDGSRKSLVEIGQIFHMSKEWVRKVEKAALDKLRRRDDVLAALQELHPL